MAAAGKAKYDAKKHALVWKIKRFTGQTESALVASVELIATTREKKAWAKPPINMSFQVMKPNPPFLHPTPTLPPSPYPQETPLVAITQGGGLG